MPKDNEMSRVSQKKNQKKAGKRKKNQKKQKANKSWFKRIVVAIVALFIIALLSGIGLFAYYASNAPEISEDDLIDNPSSIYFDPNGEEFNRSAGEERIFVEAGSIPQVLVDAVLSIEDQRFFNHIGVDPIRIAGAVLANVTDGFGAEGGSTITQQLIKLSVFSTKKADQTLQRKAQEAWLAIKLEQEYSKEQILTFYINKVYMSDNQYGMGTASEYYFGKPISELELHEAALLAGMSQAPNAYNPHTNPEQAKKRRDTVLYMMNENEKISQEEMKAAQEIPVTEGLVDNKDQSVDALLIDSYLSTVNEEVREKTGLDPQTAGLKIYTNIDMSAQEEVYNVLNSDEYNIFPNDEMQTAVTVVDVHTGQLKAIGGGRKQDTQLAFNHAVDEEKNIGSTIKPLTTYGPAIEYLDYSTYHQVKDEPTNYSSGQAINNWDRSYEGQISMRRALVNSRNVPTYKIFKDVGQENVKKFLENVGLSNYHSLAKDNKVYESDSFSGTMTLVDLAGSYAPFANGGNYTEPYTVSKVVTADGEEIDLTPSTTQAMKDSTAYMVTDMLKDVVSSGSTGRLVGISGVPQAGKTGTSNYAAADKEKFNIPSGAVPDSTFVGYTSNYSVSVWTGYANKLEEGHWLSNDDGTREIPRIVYHEVMEHISESVENKDWSKPSSVVEVAVEKGSNPAALPSASTPSSEIVRELFVKGTQPTNVSTTFDEELSAPSGLKASYDAETNEIVVNWDAYSLDNSEQSVAYELSIGAQKLTTNDLGYVVQNPAEGTTEIKLSVIAYGKTGPAATVSVVVPPSGDEEESSEEDEESESEESESSSDDSSESSSSESSSSKSEESSSSSSQSSESSIESSSTSSQESEDEGEEEE